jgi:hypothetical protein
LIIEFIVCFFFSRNAVNTHRFVVVVVVVENLFLSHVEVAAFDEVDMLVDQGFKSDVYLQNLIDALSIFLKCIAFFTQLV